MGICPGLASYGWGDGNVYLVGISHSLYRPDDPDIWFYVTVAQKHGEIAECHFTQSVDIEVGLAVVVDGWVEQGWAGA